MKININLFVVLTLSVVMFGCGGSSDTVKEEDAVAEQEEQHHEHTDDGKDIELNNGEKWQVNEEMKPFVNQSEQLLDDYKASEAQDHKALAEQLKDENNKLIKSCTMKGKSHDELHKWLYPHIGMIEALHKAEDKDEAEVVIADLEESFDTYHTYFQ